MAYVIIDTEVRYLRRIIGVISHYQAGIAESIPISLRHLYIDRALLFFVVFHNRPILS